MKKVHLFLLAMGIFLSPFITSLGVQHFGGLGKEGSFYPIAAGVFVWLIEILFLKKSVHVPSGKSIYFFYAFLVIIIFSGVVNFFDILELRFQGEIGIGRCLVQTGTMFFYFLVVLYVYNIFYEEKRNQILFFRRWILLSFVLAGAYSLLELGKIGGNSLSSDVIIFIDHLFRAGGEADDISNYFRIRSLTAEASYFGMYIAIVLPWVLEKSFLDRSRYQSLFFLVFGYIIVLVLFSLSRTAYMVVAIELVVFLLMFPHVVWEERKRLSVFVIVFFTAAVLSSEFISATLPKVDVAEVYESLLSDNNLSNVARYGSQLAAWNIFLEHPILGVGYGMYGFYAPDYYPEEAWRSVEISMWATNGSGWPWPPAHSLYARVLAELGGLGLLVYGALLISLFCAVWRCGTTKDIGRMTEKRILALTMLGIVLQGVNVDAFRIMPMWIVFALILVVASKGREES